MTYDAFDLTGTNALYKRTDRRFTIYKTNQLIQLQEPAYLSSIKVYRVYENNAVDELVYGTHWTTNASHEDVTYTAKAKSRYYSAEGTAWNVNNTTIVNAFVMMDTSVPNEYQISVEYQSLFRDLSAVDDYTASGPAYSPGMMRSLLEKVEYLISVKNPVTSVSSSTLFSIRSLDEDLTGYKEDNYIHGETHTINVPNNIFVIRPVNGSFYKHDLVIRHNDEILVENTDYIVTGINHGKTKVSLPNSGVYEYIIITKAIAGAISVDYRAFGGIVSQRDITAIRDIIAAIVLKLSGDGPDTGSDIDTAISNLEARVDSIETTVQHYQVRSFPYTVNTNGWVNIAVIDKNPWSAQELPLSAGMGEFRISIDNESYYLDMRLSYNIYSQKALAIDVVQTHEPTYEYDGVNYFNLRITPMFRLLWDGSAPEDCGFILQMKIDGSNERVVNVRIHDKTGADSPWTLVNSNGQARPDSTNSTPYPREPNHTWTSSNGQQSNTIALYNTGYTIFVGQIPITIVEESSYDIEPEELPVATNGLKPMMIVDNAIMSPELVKAVRFKIYDKKTANYLVVESSQLRFPEPRIIYAIAMYCISDLCSIECQITINKLNNNYSLQIRSTSGSNSLANDRFELNQIDLLG